MCMRVREVEIEGVEACILVKDNYVIHLYNQNKNRKIINLSGFFFVKGLKIQSNRFGSLKDNKK